VSLAYEHLHKLKRALWLLGDAKLKQTGMPACEVGVVQRSTVIWSRGYGLADVENNIPISTETRFDIGSISKQFLSMAILILAADGKFGWTKMCISMCRL
jgi:CubicO group peptidase (beta-lactamase class C family)